MPLDGLLKMFCISLFQHSTVYGQEPTPVKMGARVLLSEETARAHPPLNYTTAQMVNFDPVLYFHNHSSFSHYFIMVSVY